MLKENLIELCDKIYIVFDIQWLLSFIVTSLAHWFICCCILCMCFRFRCRILYILVYIDTPDDNCGYSEVLEWSSLYC